VISHATQDTTVSRRLNVGEELSTWLGALPVQAGYPNTLSTARPQELLVFMHSHFIQAHAGSRVPGHDDLVASPSGVTCCFSHLSTLFESLGRRGPYDAATGLGNPCSSVEVKNYKQGYKRDLWSAGYQETSAVPMTASTMARMVAHYDHLGSKSSSVFERITYARDALLVLYAWASALRGKEGGQLCLADLHFSASRPIYPDGYKPGCPPPRELLILPTHGTKTNKRSRSHQDPIQLQLGSDPALCFITRLWAYLELCHPTEHAVSHFLLRPWTSFRGNFKEAPYSSSSFNELVKGTLIKLDLYQGDTAHSFRRGTLQATAAAGGPLLGNLAAALQGRIKTPSILDRYLDPHRHLGRVKRVAP
jgi:hypothetical protein